MTPPLTTMSSTRPSTCSRPSSSSRPASEVRNQPSTSTSAVAAGSPSYPSKSVGPAIRIRPSRVERDRDPVERVAVVDAAARGLGRAVRRDHAHVRPSSARRRSAGSIGPPPSSTVWKLRSASASVSSSRCSWVGTRETNVRVADAASANDAWSSSSTGSWPATSERQTTCTPATYDGGSASSQRPGRRAGARWPRPRRARRRGRARTRFGAPVEPDVSTTHGSGSSPASQAQAVDGARGPAEFTRPTLVRA